MNLNTSFVFGKPEQRSIFLLTSTITFIIILLDLSVTDIMLSKKTFKKIKDSTCSLIKIFWTKQIQVLINFNEIS